MSEAIKLASYLPLSEAVEFVPYSAEYLSLLCRKGRLKALKKGGIWWIDKKTLANYWKEQKLKHKDYERTNHCKRR